MVQTLNCKSSIVQHKDIREVWAEAIGRGGAGITVAKATMVH